MTRLWIVPLFVLISGVAKIGAQTAANDFKSHVLWERELPDARAWGLSGATSDKSGGLWLICDVSDQKHLVHFGPSGKLLSSVSLPPAFSPKPPADASTMLLAAAPSGAIGLLTDYHHAIGKNIYEDGASFGLIEEGKIGTPRQIAGPGPTYEGIQALSDNHFLVMGNQAPFVLIDINSQGEKIWRRDFSSKWVLPSGAALENGTSCVVTPGYSLPRLRVLRLDGSGRIRHEAEIAAREAMAAAGPNGNCTILFERTSGFKRGEFFVTMFDASLKRQWTVPVKIDAPWGASFHLVTASDGYVVVVEPSAVAGSLFVAKYDFSGGLLWSAIDGSRRVPSLVVASGDNFYLIGANSNGHSSLSVIRAH